MARQQCAVMDIQSLRYPSWCLGRFLDQGIGTKEEVALRRKIHTISFFVMNVESYELLHSGSRGEGFNFQSSDVDLMIIDPDIAVMESIHSLRPDDDRKTVLLLTREGCNPGFGILQLLNRTNDGAVEESIVEYHSHPVVSSLLYRDVHRRAENGQFGHGPCNTFNYVKDIDMAHCFECSKWPTEANEFIYRQRPHGWPPKFLLDKIISRGCHLVPIGDKDHDLSYIQWRLSFSAAEKDLVLSFNHTQFLVYGLMKIFLKQVIDKFHSVRGLLCSYFLKTVMFYSIETTPLSLWRDDLLIPCFWFCLNKLIQWVERGYCPNYFVPQNNMFRSKVFGQNQSKLLSVLNHCKLSGWKCISLCADQLSFDRFETSFSSGLIPNEEQRESGLDCITFGQPQVGTTDPHLIHRKRTLTCLCYSRSQQEIDISTLLLCGILRINGLNTCINGGVNNKGKYRKSYRMLLSSAASNIFTESLYLATFYHLTGQYRKAVHVCNRVISQWKPYVRYRSAAHNVIFNEDMYQRYVCGRGVSALNKAKSALAYDILLDLDTKDFYPAELRCDVEASDPFPAIVPPIPYTVFLSFLCHHKLGNIDDSVTALHDLRVIVHDKQQGCNGYPIVLNMLAVCQDKLGDLQGAIETCIYSQALKPDRNGAGTFLESLLWRYC